MSLLTAPASYPLDLRLVTSVAPGTCTADPLRSDAGGNACDESGSTTFALGPLLATVVPKTVTDHSSGAKPSVAMTFGPTDTATLSDLTATTVNKQVAVLLDGKVIAAPVLKAPITNGQVTFTYATVAQAQSVASALGVRPAS